MGFLPPSQGHLLPRLCRGKVKSSGHQQEVNKGQGPPTPFHTVALDIWGPMSTPDIGGNRWVLGGVCYKTSLIFGNLMKFKSDATITWKSIIAKVKSMGHSISRLRIDNDTVFLCSLSSLHSVSQREYLWKGPCLVLTGS